VIFIGEYQKHTEMPLDGTIATTESTSVLCRGKVFNPIIPFPLFVLDDEEGAHLHIGGMNVFVIFAETGLTQWLNSRLTDDQE